MLVITFAIVIVCAISFLPREFKKYREKRDKRRREEWEQDCRTITSLRQECAQNKQLHLIQLAFGNGVGYLLTPKEFEAYYRKNGYNYNDTVKYRWGRNCETFRDLSVMLGWTRNRHFDLVKKLLLLAPTWQETHGVFWEYFAGGGYSKGWTRWADDVWRRRMHRALSNAQTIEEVLAVSNNFDSDAPIQWRTIDPHRHRLCIQEAMKTTDLQRLKWLQSLVQVGPGSSGARAQAVIAQKIRECIPA